MKSFFLFFFFIICSFQLQGQQVNGRVISKGTTVSGAEIFIEKHNISTTTNKKGRFMLMNVPIGTITIVIEHPDIESISKTIDIKDNEIIELDDIEVKYKDFQQENLKQEIALISLEDIETEDELSSLGTGNLLGASQDVFTKATAWVWGPQRFRARGYDSKYTTILLNGIDFKDLTTFRPNWLLWGGLNDVTRNVHTVTSLNPISQTWGNIGGVRNIEMRASSYRRGSKISYAHTNRTYSSRIVATHSTGVMKNGWALTLSGSRRVGQDHVYTDGTYYDAWSYFLSVEKRINLKHSVGIIAFGAPNERGSYGAATQEIYDLVNDNYYNRYWGYQNGKKRNARIKDRHQPVLMLSHYWDINSTTSLNTTISYKFGKYGSTRIERYNSYSDRPDYRRNLPSYYYLKGDTETAQSYEELWQNSPLQINWDYFYKVNYLNNDKIENTNGINGYTVTGLRSKYILENHIKDDKQWGINTIFQRELNENVTLNGSLTFDYLQQSNYKEVDDLLGGHFFVDIDQYATLDYPNDPNKYQNDLQHPNRIVKEGDIFGYNYDLYIQNYEVFAQTQFAYNKYDFFIAGKLGTIKYQREGYMQNGLMPNNSLGKSKRLNYIEFAFKGGFTYKLNGHNFFSINGVYEQKTPEAKHVFAIPGENNTLVSDVKEETIYGGDINYIYRSPGLKARATFYYTQFQHTNWNGIQILYGGLGGGDIGFLYNYLVGANKRHYGFELGIEYEIYPGLNVHGAASLGKYIFTNNPRLIAYEDHTSAPRFDEPSYLKEFYASESPQKAYYMSISYQHPKHWYFNIDAKYYHDNYLQVNPIYRTQTLFNGALERYASNPRNPDPVLVDDIVRQEDLPNAFMIDINIGKSILITYNHRLYLTLMVANVLDKTNYITGGYENLGYYGTTYRYRPYYYYAFGRTYYFVVSFKF